MHSKWASPGLAVLAKGKRLRGTRLDPFGRAEVRRIERELIPEFEAVLDRLMTDLRADPSAESLERAIEIAALPDMVRGYEDLKLRRVVEYRARLRSYGC